MLTIINITQAPWCNHLKPHLPVFVAPCLRGQCTQLQYCIRCYMYFILICIAIVVIIADPGQMT